MNSLLLGRSQDAEAFYREVRQEKPAKQALNRPFDFAQGRLLLISDCRFRIADCGFRIGYRHGLGLAAT